MHNSPTSSLLTFLSDVETSESKSVLTSRTECSLSVITKRFLQILMDSPNMEIDLNYAATTLEIHKRRLYDITNVLEGIGFIKKKLKNNVQYLGRGASAKCSTCNGTVAVPSKEVKEMEKYLEIETELDKELEMLNTELLIFANQKETVKLAYITYSDLQTLSDLSEIALFAVKTPPGALIDFPATDQKTENVITFSSNHGKIDVFYLQDTVDRIN